jgi:hypothetical protein
MHQDLTFHLSFVLAVKLKENSEDDDFADRIARVWRDEVAYSKRGIGTGDAEEISRLV